MKLCSLILVICMALVSLKAKASPNEFIYETERLIAFSDKTFTVVVQQYEQTYAYGRGFSRLIIRVIDFATNEVLSEVLLSSVEINISNEAPFEITFQTKKDEEQAFEKEQIAWHFLYDHLEQPKHRFNIDSDGVFVDIDGRQDVLDFSVVEKRFSSAGSKYGRSIDASQDLELAISSKNFAFTGW